MNFEKIDLSKYIKKLNLKLPPVMETKLDNTDTVFIFLISVISFGIHFWIIQHPSHVIFDEVHFGNFTNWYTKSTFFFDIHPPLGKMIMFLLANLSEYDGNIEFDGEYGHPYEDESYLCIRLVPPFFSAMCVPLLYMCVRFASFSHCAALSTAVIIMFDTSMVSEHRFILSDGMLHFFCALHLCVLSYSLSIKRYTTKFRIWQVIAGITLGAACSCKNTAWGLMALNGFIHIAELIIEYEGISPEMVTELFIRGVTLAGLTLFVYIAAFAVHFVLLPFNGQGTGYLTKDMRQQLIDSGDGDMSLWAMRVKGHGLIYRAFKLTFIMHVGNMEITQWHPYQSRPIGWPLLTDIFVAFWMKDKHEVACIGNVFSYYLAFIGIVCVLFGHNKEKFLIAVRFTFGWAVSYFPFYLVPRTMYLYHYLIPLMIGACAFGAVIDLFVPRELRGAVAVLACFLCLIGFILWSPYVYGYIPWDKSVTIWNDNWIYGDSYHRKLSQLNGKGNGITNTRGIVII